MGQSGSTVASTARAGGQWVHGDGIGRDDGGLENCCGFRQLLATINQTHLEQSPEQESNEQEDSSDDKRDVMNASEDLDCTEFAKGKKLKCYILILDNFR